MQATDETQLTTGAGARIPARADTMALPIWREAFTGFEWMRLHASPVYGGFGAAKGEGTAVVVVPGFMASDRSLFELHGWLARVGYRPYFSGIGRNVRCPKVHIERLIETVERAYDETGERVTIIGHSLGGCIGRGAAIQRPDLISQVISLGSPVQGGATVHPLIAAAAVFLRGDCAEDCYTIMQECLPPDVAETNIYSKTDGIVDWHLCARDRDAENIAVTGTHIGMIWNAQVYRALARVMSEHRTHSSTRRTRKTARTFVGVEAVSGKRRLRCVA